MTASLSKKAIGESHRPRGKCCVSWQAEAARHAVIPVPLDTDGIEERAGLAADRVPARYLDTWARLQCQRPSYAPVDTWQRAIEDGGRFGRVVRCAARWPAGRPSLATERRAG
jgi:hypothetical protein